MKIPLIIVIVVSFAFGVGWGIRIHRDREANAGRLKPNVTMRVLSYRGLFSRELVAKFEAEHDLQVQVTEATDPEDLWNKLELHRQPGEPEFDVVTLFSYQLPLAFQLGRLQLLDSKKIENWNATSPDFREIPGHPGINSVVPILWGLTGIIYDQRKTDEPGSWPEILKNPKLKGKIALPASTIDVMRLLGPKALSAADLSKPLATIEGAADFAPDFLSPSRLVVDKPLARPWLALVSHGETAFAPWRGPEWKFVLPEEGGALWILSLAIHANSRNQAEAYGFMDYVLRKETSEALTISFHQASTNRSLESSQLDARLKPSYLREIPLTKISLWKDFSRAREIRAYLVKSQQAAGAY